MEGGGSHGRSAVRSRFKTAEGRYHMLSEKTTGLIPFNYQRTTRLSLATLTGGNEDGVWVIYNVADNIHISRRDASTKEPSRSLAFTSTASRVGFPQCHAYCAAKDGCDLLVGATDGQVMLLSLRTQLQSSLVNGKPTVTCALTPEGTSDTARCTAVVWINRADGGTMFAAAFASGVVYLYKKSAVMGEGGSKLSFGMNGKSSNPSSSFTVGGGGINDLAASPDGTRLAAACRDGALRILDVSTGAVVGGYQSYYGALLCCAFSGDGKYVAAGGEDDLVSVYGIAERATLAHGEGHDSWISRVAFDPWAPVNEVAGALSDLAPSTRVYRLASVGQDARMCLWDVQLAPDGDNAPAVGSGLPNTPTMKKNNSNQNFLSLPASPGRTGEAAALAVATHAPRTSATGGGSMTKPGGSGICPAQPRSEMYIMQPIVDHRLHVEPLSDVLCLEDVLLTGDHGGCIKSWARPTSTIKAEEAGNEPMSQ